MDFDEWLEKNESELISKFDSDNPELNILDDDYADLWRNPVFFDFCGEEYESYLKTKEEFTKIIQGD